MAGGVLRCGGKFPSTLAKSAKIGKICTQWSQFPRDFWQTEYTESMENMFWMLYPVLGSLGAKGGKWGAEMQEEISPTLAKSAKLGKICTQ